MTDHNEPSGTPAVPGAVTVTASRTATVGNTLVRRALPLRSRRTVGPWCFADHMGPTPVSPTQPFSVGPHPHIGLHTVTWLTDGELIHHDSLGSEQPIRPGELNVMTAGDGVVHSEQSHATTPGRIEGIQLWVAQPDASRHGPAAFVHHTDLPTIGLHHGQLTLLAGTLPGLEVTGPTTLSDEGGLVGCELKLTGDAVVPINPRHEHAVVVLSGSVGIDDIELTPGNLGHVAPGRHELAFRVNATATVMLLGGPPFDEPLLMWWNFVARHRHEIEQARAAWVNRDERFGPVDTPLARVPAPGLPWQASSL